MTKNFFHFLISKKFFYFEIEENNNVFKKVYFVVCFLLELARSDLYIFFRIVVPNFLVIFLGTLIYNHQYQYQIYFGEGRQNSGDFLN